MRIRPRRKPNDAPPFQQETRTGTLGLSSVLQYMIFAIMGGIVVGSRKIVFCLSMFYTLHLACFDLVWFAQFWGMGLGCERFWDANGFGTFGCVYALSVSFAFGNYWEDLMRSATGWLRGL